VNFATEPLFLFQIYLYDCSPVSPYSLLFFGGDITYRKVRLWSFSDDTTPGIHVLNNHYYHHKIIILTSSGWKQMSGALVWSILSLLLL